MLMAITGFTHASEGWKPRNNGVEKLGSDEKAAYRFERGFLDGERADFKNGIIEFELKPTRERAFFYVYFRRQSSTESEVVYIRTHKSNAPDTIQYSPVFQGRSAWQLYHGKSGTASATLPIDDWVKIKLQVMGNRLSMWVGDNPKANIKDMILTGSGKAGGISFRGNIPRNSSAEHTAVIRNVNIRRLAAVDSITGNDLEVKPGTIVEYKVSPTFEVAKKSSQHIPQEILNRDWTTLATNSQGVLELLRHRIIPQDVRTWAVAADVVLNAQLPTQCQVDLGFSDAMTLILNGKTEFFADASYRYRVNRQEGLMHAKQMSVFLDLKAGKNTLRAIVADSFGGWGLQAQLVDCNGVHVVHSIP